MGFIMLESSYEIQSAISNNAGTLIKMIPLRKPYQEIIDLDIFC